MKIYLEKDLTLEEKRKLLKRPSLLQNWVESSVHAICLDVKSRGDKAVRDYTKKFDKVDLQDFRVSSAEIESAINSVTPAFKTAVKVASENIRKFHESQKVNLQKIETFPGITCWREIKPIETVGLYIPAGTAPLPSTVLMLGIPALIAGCNRIIICSPPKNNGTVDSFVLATASLIGIEEIYKVGGVQAIAAMAYGTETIPKVDKIFGPGNKYVTSAKQFVSMDPDGAGIDLIAGPSEVLVIADSSASAIVTAYDLISQAEHDPDAQSILVTPDKSFAENVCEELNKRITEIPRSDILKKSLQNGFILVTEDITSAINFSNLYAPEHLILNIKNAESVISLIKNAGSVFVGSYSPVTAGDYASGTNHTLPTSGTARSVSGISLESFQKYISFQILTENGLRKIAPTLSEFAKAEGLIAHNLAVDSRL